MEYTKVILILLISLPCTIRGSQQKDLPDLRRFKTEGVGGRFVLNRDTLETVLQDRKKQDAACGQGKDLHICLDLLL